MKFVTRVHEQIGVDLALDAFLKGGATVQALSQQIDQNLERPEHGKAAPALTRRQRTVPLSYAQEHLWFLERMGSLNGAYNQFLAVRLEGALDVRALERSLDEAIRRHEMLRTRIIDV